MEKGKLVDQNNGDYTKIGEIVRYYSIFCISYHIVSEYTIYQTSIGIPNTWGLKYAF